TTATAPSSVATSATPSTGHPPGQLTLTLQMRYLWERTSRTRLKATTTYRLEGGLFGRSALMTAPLRSVARLAAITLRRRRHRALAPLKPPQSTRLTDRAFTSNAAMSLQMRLPSVHSKPTHFKDTGTRLMAKMQLRPLAPAKASQDLARMPPHSIRTPRAAQSAMVSTGRRVSGRKPPQDRKR